MLIIVFLKTIVVDLIFNVCLANVNIFFYIYQYKTEIIFQIQVIQYYKDYGGWDITKILSLKSEYCITLAEEIYVDSCGK
ncbi:hypothetical protein J2Z23_004512 [Lederbergia galactosidilyticus]|nr:hypothetical protein [Lederbergia galactosidilytica]